MVKFQKFKKEYALELLRIAKGDLETTEALYSLKKGRNENICFLAQQVIEKSIKAVICHLEIPVPFTHSLETLVIQLPDQSFFSNFKSINELTEYATIRRYEEGVVELDESDLLFSVDVAKKTFEWAQKQILNQ